MKKLSSCKRKCMAKSQVSLEVQDDNGGSARGMEWRHGEALKQRTLLDLLQK